MWIEPITDRTINDVVNRTEKGAYDNTDLNRIENNNGQLAGLFRALPDEIEQYRIAAGVDDSPEFHVDYNPDFDPDPKTDWESWDNPVDGGRIIGTIATMLTMARVTAQLPLTLNRLNYIGANQIEKAQLIILVGIDKLRQYYFDLIDEAVISEIFGGRFSPWVANETEIFGGRFSPWTTDETEIFGGEFTDWN